LLHLVDLKSHDHLFDDQSSIYSGLDSHLPLLTPEQYYVASKIIEAVLHETRQLMFLHGSAGTGKTFTVKALISALQSHYKMCLIYGTTGIAAVQYSGGTTLHSLFLLGIDEQSRRCFRPNIGQGAPLFRYILAADLITIDEGSMLVPWVVNRVSLTLQSISGLDGIEFGGKRIRGGHMMNHPIIIQEQRHSGISEAGHNIVRNRCGHKPVKYPNDVIGLYLHPLQFMYPRDQFLCRTEETQIQHLELVRRMWWWPHHNNPVFSVEMLEFWPAMR
jgi:hypothetical protein